MTASTPGVSVVIVTYNSADVLGGLLDTIRAGTAGLSDVEVVVADNASRDASVALARAHPAVSRVVETGRNGGYSAAINAAARDVPADRCLLVLNPDVRLHPAAVTRLVEALADPSVGIAVPRTLDETQALALSIRREPSLLTCWTEALLGGRLAARLGASEIVEADARYRDGGAVDWATGAILLVSPAARRLIGEWEESFFLYSEETDYMRRAREAGFEVRYVPEASAWHIGGEHVENPRLFAILTANRIRYFRRYHGPVATAVFRLGVIAGEALRSVRGAGHRAALKAAIRRLQPWPQTPRTA